jgi:predicted MFS family arabinose efflux permease
MIPFILMSLPVMADQRYAADPHTAGWLLASWGGGAVIGVLMVTSLARRIPPLRLGAVAGVALAIPLWFLAIRQPALSVALILALSGIFSPMLNAPGITILTTRPPEELRAQVATFFVTAATLASPMAYAVAGLLFAHFGVSKVQFVVAICLTACAGILLSLVVNRRSAAQRQVSEEPTPIDG